jgi:uncharacterized protein YcaQ
MKSSRSKSNQKGSLDRRADLRISSEEVRRIALTAQGFARGRPAKAGLADLRRVSKELIATQIDSVNVLIRSHYLPAYSRLGPYRQDSLDDLAYKSRELFEYWGHAASFLPTSAYPLFRWRMDLALGHAWGAAKGRDAGYVQAILDEVRSHGPLSASELSDPGTRRGPWWGWAEGKQALEWLYASGQVAIAGRRRFERLYDIPERVIPKAILDEQPPSPDEAKKQLILLSAKALGVATVKDLAWYLYLESWWERAAADGKRAPSKMHVLLDQLVEEKRLVPVEVEGWRHAAYMHPGSKEKSIEARALVSPFDSLVWERARTQRLFDFNYRIEIYVPAPKRQHGYYVLPFLLGDSLVARTDLKADRKGGRLLVQSAFVEMSKDKKQIASELAAELRQTADWLGLDEIVVVKKGDLAAALAREIKPRKKS